MENLNNLTEKLLTYVQNTEDFLIAETPGYIQELLAYGFFDKILNVCLFGIITIICVIGVVYFIKRGIKDNEIFFGVATLIGVMAILLTSGMLYNLKVVYKIKYAPKVYIVEQIQGLAK